MKQLKKFVVITLALVLLTSCSILSPAPSPSLTELKEWDLVFISDSTGFGVADKLAAAIEQDLGVTVKVHDLSIGTLSALKVLNGLSSGDEPNYTLSQLPKLIPEAEFVVFTANPLDQDGYHPTLECMDQSPYHLESCSLDTYSEYKETLNSIYEEIFRLRRGAPTIIRTYDFWYRPDWWKEGGALNECLQCVGNMNSTIYEVAEANNIPVAHVAEAFNGPKFDENPLEKGYLGDDNEHPNEAGQDVIAELLRELGYEPVIVP